jgi:hypothetical protein
MSDESVSNRPVCHLFSAIRVAAAVPTIIKKLSQPWSIVKQCSPSAAFAYYELRGRKWNFQGTILVRCRR